MVAERKSGGGSISRRGPTRINSNGAVGKSINDAPEAIVADEVKSAPLRLVRIMAPDVATFERIGGAVEAMFSDEDIARVTIGNDVEGHDRSIFINAPNESDPARVREALSDVAGAIKGWRGDVVEYDSATGGIRGKYELSLPKSDVLFDDEPEQDDVLDEADGFADDVSDDGASDANGDNGFDDGQTGVDDEFADNSPQDDADDSADDFASGLGETVDDDGYDDAYVPMYGDDGGFIENDAPSIDDGVQEQDGAAEDEFIDEEGYDQYDDDEYPDEDEVEREQRLQREAEQRREMETRGIEPLKRDDSETAYEAGMLDYVSTLELNPELLVPAVLPVFAPTDVTNALEHSVSVDVIAPNRDQMLALAPAVGLNEEDDLFPDMTETDYTNERDNTAMIAYLDETARLSGNYANDRAIVRSMSPDEYREVQSWAIDLVTTTEPKRLKRLDDTRNEMLSSIQDVQSAVAMTRAQYADGMREAMAAAALDAAEAYAAENRAATVNACDDVMADGANAVAKQLSSHAMRAYEALVYAEHKIETPEDARAILGRDVDVDKLRAYLSAARYRIMSDRALSKLVEEITTVPEEEYYDDTLPYDDDYAGAPQLGDGGYNAAAPQAPQDGYAPAQTQGQPTQQIPVQGADAGNAPSMPAQASADGSAVPAAAAASAALGAGAVAGAVTAMAGEQGAEENDMSSVDAAFAGIPRENGAADADGSIDSGSDADAPNDDSDDVFGFASDGGDFGEVSDFDDSDDELDDFFGSSDDVDADIDEDDIFGDGDKKSKKLRKAKKQKKSKDKGGSSGGSKKLPIIIGGVLALAVAAFLAMNLFGGQKQSNVEETQVDSHGLYEVGQQFSATADNKQINITISGFIDDKDNDANDRVIAKDENGQEYQIEYSQMEGLAGGKQGNSANSSQASSSSQSASSGNSTSDNSQNSGTSSDSSKSDSSASASQGAASSNDSGNSASSADVSGDSEKADGSGSSEAGDTQVAETGGSSKSGNPTQQTRGSSGVKTVATGE